MSSRFLGVSGGLVAVLWLVLPAGAHPLSHEVSVGGSTVGGSHLFYASDVNGVAFAVNNGTTTTPLSCGDVNLEGVANSGLDVDPFLEIKPVSRLNTPDGFDGSERKNCVGPFNLALTVVQINDWEVHATGPATTAGTDLLPAYLSGPNNGPLYAHVYATPGGPSGTSCNFFVEGYADGTFNEATQTLNIDETGFSGDLTIVSAPGSCLGLATVGSRVNAVSSFEIGDDDVANVKGNITSNHPILLSP